MSGQYRNILNNIFYTDAKEKAASEQQTADLQQKIDTAYGKTSKTTNYSINPFLDKNGELFNKNLDYQSILDNPNISKNAKTFITQATGLSQTQKDTSESSYEEYSKKSNVTSSFNPNLDDSTLASLDVTTELPKLNESQISNIISTHFKNSTVITPKDAQGIYEAQEKSGMSALAILGIGALESGYGTSNIAKKKNNIWGWNATNVNPGGNAKSFSQMSQGALEFANAFMKTYYNGYGAKSIYSAGTGNNPAGKGYAYLDNGSVDSSWSTKVGSIMQTFYNTAKSTVSNLVDSAKQFIGTPYVWGGDNETEGGLDCSGFVYNALKSAGYNVDRTTAQGYRSYGTTVSKENMQPGDLVFFGKNGKATHIGIYMGNGQMIHSSGGSKNTKSNPGKGVSIANVNSRSDFLEARRY